MIAPAKLAEAKARESGEVERLLDLLDTALAAYRLLVPHRNAPGVQVSRLVTLMATSQPHAEYATALWASTNGFRFDEQITRFDHAPYFANEQIRTRSVRIDGVAVIVVQCEPEPIAREPRVRCDEDQMWRPTDGGSL